MTRPRTHQGPSPPALLPILVLAMGAGPLLVYSMSALSPVLIDELGLAASDFGVLATTSFLFAVPLSFVAGRLSDSGSGRFALFGLFFVSAVALILLAVAGSFVWLFAAAVVCSWTQAISNPLTNRLVSRNISPGKQGAVIGVKQSGVQVSQVVAGVFLPSLALLTGWRGAAALMAGGMLVAGAFSIWAVPKREHWPGPAIRERQYDVSPRVWLLIVYTALMASCVQATNVYAPLASHAELGFSNTAAGFLVAVIGAAGLVARVWWGRATERVADPAKLLTVLSLLTAVASVLIVAGLAKHVVIVVWVAALMHGSAALPITVVVVVTMMRWTPRQYVGRNSAALGVGLFAGFAAGPVSFGAIVAQTGGYSAPWLTVGFVSTLAALVMQTARILER